MAELFYVSSRRLTPSISIGGGCGDDDTSSEVSQLSQATKQSIKRGQKRQKLESGGAVDVATSPYHNFAARVNSSEDSSMSNCVSAVAVAAPYELVGVKIDVSKLDVLQVGGGGVHNSSQSLRL